LRVIITENVSATGSTSLYGYAAAANALLYVDGAGVVNGALATSHNTLDDGSVDTTISGALSVSGTTSVKSLTTSKNTMDDREGNLMFEGLVKSVSVSASNGNWFILGTIAIPQNGYAARIELNSGDVHNASDTQISSVMLAIRTSNGNSPGQAGTFVSANAWTYGKASQYTQVSLIQNEATPNVSSYKVWFYCHGQK